MRLQLPALPELGNVAAAGEPAQRTAPTRTLRLHPLPDRASARHIIATVYDSRLHKYGRILHYSYSISYSIIATVLHAPA